MKAIIFAFLLCFGLTRSAHAQEPIDVSMVQLIGNPEKFHGTKVRLIGYLHLEFEGDAIYLHREDFSRAILKNALSIDLTTAQQKSLSKLNNSYVLVEGLFSAEGGNMGAWSGALQQVNRVSNWSVDRSRRTASKKQ